MTPIRSRRSALLDTCGTGGDGAKTFNISTAAAIVASAAGASIAKHGNRKITSATGSADVLAELGIRIDASRETVEQCLDQLGICFCFAPLLHPAMKHVAEVRRSLGVPTLFNLLGPICNPAQASYQVLGVGKESFAAEIGGSRLASACPKRLLSFVAWMAWMRSLSRPIRTSIMFTTDESTSTRGLLTISD